MRAHVRVGGVLAISWLLCACDDEANYARHHDADVTIGVFCSAVINESNHQNPDGWLTQSYDPQHWIAYWDDRLWFTVVNPGPRHPEYIGPGNEAIMQWVLRERRVRNLPDLGALPKSGDAALRLYKTAAAGAALVDAYMRRRGTECSVGQAAA